MFKKITYSVLIALCLTLAPISNTFASDPATKVSNGWCYNKYKWNGTYGRLYYPANGSCSYSRYSPLVVIMKGYGYDIKNYHYLARHLAKNGFIAVIVDPIATSSGFTLPSVSDYQDTADKAWAFVTDFVWTKWSKRFYIDPSNIGLIGHSRGGEAVRYLANNLAGDSLFNVKAVIGLAATNHTNQYLGAGDALAALYIHGTKDGDVPPRQSVNAYDKTGNEASQNDIVFNSNVLDKTFKLLLNGNHPSFTSKLTTNSDIPTQRAATQGYALAFLKANLADDFTWYDDYIRGDEIPGGYINDVYTQYADGIHRRVIDHFENGNTGFNSLGDFVLKSSSIVWSTLNLGLDVDNAHDTLALSIQSENTSGWVQWNIPWWKRNATVFDWLSLRIGQQAAGTAAADISVQLLNFNIWSPPVKLTDYGPIAQPVTVCLKAKGTGCLAGAPKMEHMSTIHIPLKAFGFYNNVRAVRIRIDGESIDEEYLIDNLAFTD